MGEETPARTGEAALGRARRVGRTALPRRRNSLAVLRAALPFRPACLFWEMRARRKRKHCHLDLLHYGSFLQIRAPREPDYSPFLTAAATTSG